MFDIIASVMVTKVIFDLFHLCVELKPNHNQFVLSNHQDTYRSNRS